LKFFKHHKFACSHNISYQLSSYIPTMTSIVTKTAKTGKQRFDVIHEIHPNGENNFSNHRLQNKDPIGQN